MEESYSFVPLLIVIFLASLVPVVLSKFRKLTLPIVVGELIVGIIIGRSGFGLVKHHDPVLDLLSEFGFVFLMFLSGMEIDFSSLGSFRASTKEKTSRQMGPLQVGMISFMLTLVLSIGVGYAFYSFELVQNPWMMALILSTTSLGVVVPVLKEKGISNGSYGQSLLVSALIADFVTMFLITVLVAVLSSGLTLEILLIGVLFVAFFFMFRFGKMFFHRSEVIRRTMEELTGATSQIKVRVAFTMMLMFVALSESIGTEVILGAFLAGAIISLLKRPEDHDLEEQLNSIGYGFFIPIFFIMVGVDFNLGALIDSPQALLLAPLLIIAALVVKFIPGLVFRILYSWREAFGAGTLLSVRLSLIIAASAIGLRLGIISEPVNSAIVLVSLLTVSLMPTIFNRLIPSPKETEKQLLIVVGAGEMGVQVSEQLFRHNDHILVVADNNEQKARLERRNIPAIIAKADKGDPILEPYFEDARAMVCVYSDPERALNVCKQARFEYGIDTVISRVDDPQRVPDFENLGVITVNAAMDQAAMLAMLTTNPSLYQMLIRTDSDKHICEVNVNKYEHFGKPIRDLSLPGDLVIVALQRQGKFINSTGGTQLEEGDKLSVMGTSACVDRAMKIFE